MCEGGSLLIVCVCVCERDALLPAELRTTNFIHFFEIARVAPINRQVCAQLQGGRGKGRGRGGITLRLVRALHLICILGLCAVRCRRQRQDRNSLTWLGWVPALAPQRRRSRSRRGSGSGNEGALVASG